MVKLLTKSLWILGIFVQAVISDANSAYDFIVVGSGAGGGAVARRLAENGKFKVLVIEAGGLPKPGHDIPVYAPRFIGDPDVNFNYQSIPQRNAALYNNGTVSVVAGRMLGGTTSLNYMWFNRGHPLDWDNWASTTGDESWKYTNMLKYFKRAETYKGDFPSDQHGYHGPVTVSQPRYSPGLNYWFAAARELGYSIGDPNGPQKIGFHPVEFAKRNGRRSSSFLGYLTPILNNPNIRIMTNTTATQIIFNWNTAIGVRFISNSTNQGFKTAYATKEVIVCAGAYGSPLLLQRSGIGPKEALSAAKIPIFKELPTGLNFQDHASLNLNFIINNTSVVIDEKRDLTQQNLQFFNDFGDGPFSSGRGATGQAMISTSVAKAEGNPDWPDIQLCMSHSTEPYVSTYELHNTINLTDGETPTSSSIFLGRPKSRGSIRINPMDPIFGNPILDMGYLTDSRDLQMFLDGIAETLKIYEHTKAYQSLAARYAPVDLPDCVQYPVKSKEYWICYVQQVTRGGCHPAGTNKMGKTSDPSAVVDSELKVIGIEGLRVLDASIMPFVVNANPHAAVYGIAEKAADMILSTWGSSVGNVQGSNFKGNGYSLKHPRFQQWPEFNRWSHFQQRPSFQRQPQSHLTQADKSNFFGSVGRGSKSSRYDEHDHGALFLG